MHFHLITILPEYFQSPLSCGLLGRAIQRGLIQTSVVNPRDFTTDRHSTVDDRPYGGGPGMVMMVDPLYQALKSLPDQTRPIILTPGGQPLDHSLSCRLSMEKNIALVCGRYEGIDARLQELVQMEAVSVGDFVLNGGEAAALCLMESVSRFLPGFMGKEESVDQESFSAGLLEHPHYTRPETYQGLSVPEVLLSGHHGRIAAWQRREALEKTLASRPDLLDRIPLDSRDMEILQNSFSGFRAANLYLALVHWPVLNKMGQQATTSLTNLDIHDIARVSETYGLGGYYICTPLKDQQHLARRLLTHWTAGPGGQGNPDRARALGNISIQSTLEQAVQDITRNTGIRPRIAATSARGPGSVTCSHIRQLLKQEPVLMVLGTGYGLHDSVLSMADCTIRPVRCLNDFNHLSVRSAASIMVDRIIGDYF
ncbi:MAG: tRNA (guanosine(37)-N1)-methyltransferase TrmD [Desulfonatronovibrionaceae bacterium]